MGKVVTKSPTELISRTFLFGGGLISRLKL
jgi:hypothetical protein